MRRRDKVRRAELLLCAAEERHRDLVSQLNALQPGTMRTFMYSPSITGGGTLANLRAETAHHHQAADKVAEQVGELILHG